MKKYRRKPGAPRRCVACGKRFRPPRERATRPPRFCTRRCVFTVVGRGEYTRERAAKIGAAQRDRPKKGRQCVSYRKWMGRHEHRVVAERMLGRPLRRGEIVHHRDGNKRNNAEENLQVMTQNVHAVLHFKKR